MTKYTAVPTPRGRFLYSWKETLSRGALYTLDHRTDRADMKIQAGLTNMLILILFFLSSYGLE